MVRSDASKFYHDCLCTAQSSSKLLCWLAVMILLSLYGLCQKLSVGIHLDTYVGQ